MVVSLGFLNLHLYGLFIALGILAGALVTSRVSKVKFDDVFDFLIWMIGFGLVGARIYHVVDLWSYYSIHLNEIVMIWKGGMGIFGGILGGVLGAWAWAKNKKDSNLSFLKILDMGAIGLPIGQSIGRWGNYFNQELYGKPTNLPWGIFINPENRLIKVIDYERFHPLFLYESVLSLLVFLVLWGLVKFKKVKIGKGRLFIWYLGLYGLVRFFLEFLRIDPWMIGGANVGQVIGLGLVIISSICLIKKFKE